MSKSGVLHCPATKCQKPLMTQVAMAEGTRFVMRCPYCSCYVRVIATHTHIMKRELQAPKEACIVTDEA